MPVLPATGYFWSFGGLGRTCIIDLNAGASTAPVAMLGDDTQTDFPRPQFPSGGVEVLPSTSVTPMSDDSRRRGCVGNYHSPGKKSITDLGFPRASFPPGESCAEELDYIRLASLAASSVCAWTVTGSLLFGSPHRRVRGCSRSTLLLLRLMLFDGLDEVPVSGRKHQCSSARHPCPPSCDFK